MVGEIVLHIAEGKTFRFNRVGKGFEIFEQDQDGWNLIETAPSIDALETFLKLIKLELEFYPAQN